MSWQHEISLEQLPKILSDPRWHYNVIPAYAGVTGRDKAIIFDICYKAHSRSSGPEFSLDITSARQLPSGTALLHMTLEEITASKL